MPKCFRCGKKGLFLKLDREGLCEQCRRKADEEARIERLRIFREKEKERKKKEMAKWEAAADYIISLSDEKRTRRSGYEAVKMSNITAKGKYPVFVVIDTETTGLAPGKERIIEIGAVRFKDGIPVERFHSYVNPGRHIPARATEINHITDDMVADAPTIAQILPSLENFVGNDMVIGHNLEFDLKFLFYSGCRLTDAKRKYIDTLEQAQRMLRKPRRVYDKEYEIWDVDYDSDYDVENHKLGTLCEYYDIYCGNFHRADADAMATGELFLHLVAEKQ